MEKYNTYLLWKNTPYTRNELRNIFRLANRTGFAPIRHVCYKNKRISTAHIKSIINSVTRIFRMISGTPLVYDVVDNWGAVDKYYN